MCKNSNFAIFDAKTQKLTEIPQELAIHYSDFLDLHGNHLITKPQKTSITPSTLFSCFNFETHEIRKIEFKERVKFEKMNTNYVSF